MDGGVAAAVTAEYRGGVDPAGSGKKAAARGASTAAVLRPRDDSQPAAVDKEVGISK